MLSYEDFMSRQSLIDAKMFSTTEENCDDLNLSHWLSLSKYVLKIDLM